MLAVKRGTRLWIIVNYTLKTYFSDNNSNLAYVPAEYISSTDAQRAPFFLSEAVSDFVWDKITYRLREILIFWFILFLFLKDLEKLRGVAVYAEKRGQSGIFYPPGEIR